jgi:hypothetical protein
MAAIRSMAKLAAARAGIRVVSSEKTTLPQDHSLREGDSRDGARPGRARGPRPASDAAAQPVILWDDPVGTEAEADPKL